MFALDRRTRTHESVESKAMAWVFRLALVVATALGVLVPATAACQWVEGRGLGWTSLSIYHQETSDVFGVDGARGAFPGRGRTAATSAFFTVAMGLGKGWDVWAQVPVLRLSFEDITGSQESTGIGDTRLYVRAAPLSWLGNSLPLAIRAGVKLPVGDFDVGSSLIPLGDGQRDWELMLELGHSFYPRPIYTMGWAGYRWREARVPGQAEFGNEWFFYTAAGGDTRLFGWKFAFEGWYGGTPVLNAILARGAERQLVRVSPSILLNVGPGQVELGARFPLSGQNLPAGPDWIAGYFTRFGF